MKIYRTDFEVETSSSRIFAVIIDNDTEEIILRVPLKTIKNNDICLGRCARRETRTCNFFPFCKQLWDPSQIVETDEDTWMRESWSWWCSDTLGSCDFEPDLTKEEAGSLYGAIKGKIRKKWKYDKN